ncbi:MAG: adenylyltransferase/cytidyltransferase family protein [Clostridia bacterium]|nr:adenylyltransferase/cytidyltransferase family protein [Clostridia bacterium]
MVKVITYGTYDLLHYGHIRLLERAKALGDYLIVGVTSDDFDRTRGKINVQQSLAERIEAVKSTGLADQIIVEEYEGQKIDDIKRYGVDIFTVGSDWEGQFDYLKDYCKIIYLERTEGISSSDIRSKERELTMGIVGDYASYINKFQQEDKYVNGIKIVGICTENLEEMNKNIKTFPVITKSYNELLKSVDSVYVSANLENRYELIKHALDENKHVLSASPMCQNEKELKELFDLANNKKLILMEGVKTAYSTAYSRLLLLVKAGQIGKVISIDVTCTDMRYSSDKDYKMKSFERWGSNALLPIFQILGTDYKNHRIIAHFSDSQKSQDEFTKIDFIYDNAVASLKVAEGAKSEGELIITGTKGYIYVPAPWWKTDYFEIRFENQNDNRRFFYQLDGEGIRYELLAFTRSIQEEKKIEYIDEKTSISISKIAREIKENKNVIEI